MKGPMLNMTNVVGSLVPPSFWKLYLVGGWALPLWKNMNSSVGMMTFPIWMGQHVPKRLLAIMNHRFTRKIHVPKPPSRYYITVFHTARDPWKWFRKKTNMKCLTNTESWSGHIIPIFDPNLVVGWIHLPYINPYFPNEISLAHHAVWSISYLCIMVKHH